MKKDKNKHIQFYNLQTLFDNSKQKRKYTLREKMDWKA